MSQRVLRQIRQAVRLGNYDMTRHAIDEMAEDNLSIFDVEHAVLSGTITKTELADPLACVSNVAIAIIMPNYCIRLSKLPCTGISLNGLS